MLFKPAKLPLTFEDAMSIHVYRAQRATYMELGRRFGDHPTVFAGILAGRLYPGSWEKAVERFTAGNYWHPEIASLIDRDGYLQLLTQLTQARPGAKAAKPRFAWITRHWQALSLPRPASLR